MFKHQLKYIAILLLLITITMPVFSAPPIQSTPQPIFEVYGNEPNFEPSSNGEWDSWGVSARAVVVVDGVFHMFYDGAAASADNIRQPASIGHATSNDGISWERSGDSPILTASDVPFTDFEVSAGPVFVEEDLWTMYFSTVDDADFSSGVIGRATATEPDGEWMVDPEPIITTGDGTWDSRFIFASSLVQTDDAYWLYYTGFGDERGGAIGLATSEDGIVWEKMDDPETIDDPFAESGPIMLERGDSGEWDAGEVIQPFVRATEMGYEMFYMGLDRGFAGASLGYAISEDGIVWIKIEAKPVISNADSQDWSFLSRPQAVVIDDGTYRLYFTVVHSSERQTSVYLALGIVQ